MTQKGKASDHDEWPKSRKNHRPAALPAPIVGVCMVVGYAVEGRAFPSSAPMWMANLVGSVAPATAQQHGLVCVFYRSFRELLPSREAMLTSGAILSALNLPNRFLVGLTFVFGILGRYLFERGLYLLGLGLAHCLRSFLLANSLPGWLAFDSLVEPQILTLVIPLF